MEQVMELPPPIWAWEDLGPRIWSHGPFSASENKEFLHLRDFDSRTTALFSIFGLPDPFLKFNQIMGKFSNRKGMLTWTRS